MNETEMKVEKVYVTPYGAIFVVDFNAGKMIYRYRIKGGFKPIGASPYTGEIGEEAEELQLSEQEKQLLFVIFASDSVPIRWAPPTTTVRDAIRLALQSRALFLIP